ncbi:MAG: TIGR00296 family protein [Methanosphaera stadtmanae]|nr:TIGR00296 family protein [Methanosphaera stadtmanae]
MSQEKLTLDEGQLLIKIARENIATYLKGSYYQCTHDLPDIFHEKLGVFVTLSINSNLRGCIGYPEPYMELIEGLLDVSIAAAVDDPRFNPLSLDEFDKVQIEVSVLTKPQLVLVDSYEDYLNVLKVGRDGLIIENSYHRGLLLPQVPIEQNWDIETFLDNLCYKAGLYADAWKDENTKIYNFQAQIFEEQ